LLHFAATPAAPGTPYGCFDCSSQTGELLGWVGLLAYILLGFLIPTHLGMIQARRLKDHGRASRLGDLKALAYAAPVWICAVMSGRNRHPWEDMLWWLAGTGYLTATLSFVSGIRSTQTDPPRSSAYVGLGLALTAHIAFLTAGWSLPLGLCLALIVSVILDTGDAARAQLPASWNRWHGTFAIGAFVGALLLIPNGPSWIG
jgi:hypothetical protein